MHVILSILKIASSKWNCNILFNIAEITLPHDISKFKLGYSEFSEAYLSVTACLVLPVKQIKHQCLIWETRLYLKYRKNCGLLVQFLESEVLDKWKRLENTTYRP